MTGLPKASIVPPTLDVARDFEKLLEKIFASRKVSTVRFSR